MSAIPPLAIITMMHVIGLVALLWVALAADDRPSDNGGADPDDGRGGAPRPPADRPAGGPPLLTTAASPVRLRGPARLGDLAPTPPPRRGPRRGPSIPAPPTPTRPSARPGGGRP